MAGTAGIIAWAPVLSDGGKIGMADGSVKDFEPDFMRFHVHESVRIHDER
jgi:hypothetical protein